MATKTSKPKIANFTKTIAWRRFTKYNESKYDLFPCPQVTLSRKVNAGRKHKTQVISLGSLTANQFDKAINTYRMDATLQRETSPIEYLDFTLTYPDASQIHINFQSTKIWDEGEWDESEGWHAEMITTAWKMTNKLIDLHMRTHMHPDVEHIPFTPDLPEYAFLQESATEINPAAEGTEYTYADTSKLMVAAGPYKNDVRHKIANPSEDVNCFWFH